MKYDIKSSFFKANTSFPGNRRLCTQESNFSSSSELVPTGLIYRTFNHADFIPVHQFTVPLPVHAQPFMSNNHIRIHYATEHVFVPCGILYSYQSTEPYDERNCQIILPPTHREKIGILETARR